MNLDSFFVLIYTTLKTYEDSMTKHILIISSLVGSGHPDKYSYGILHEYLSG